MKEIVLTGNADSASVDSRVHYLTTLINNAVGKENHIDSMRQRYVTFALIMFAGLFGLGLKASGAASALVISSALFALMIVFTVLDHRLHKISHGWRRTRVSLTHHLADVINHGEQDVSFLTYCREGQRNTEWWSLQPVIYYMLVVAGALSYFALRWCAGAE